MLVAGQRLHVVALVAYAGLGAELVRAFKFAGHRAVLPLVADAMAAAVGPRLPGVGVERPAPLVVTWVPTTARRRQERGLDQAELLARALARRLRAPPAPLLVRTGGPSQTGRSGANRRRDPPRFRALGPIGSRPSTSRRGRGSAGPHRPPGVVLVDDVCTTGATLLAARQALIAAGTDRVFCAVLARTP